MTKLKEEVELHDRILELCRWANATPQSCLGKIKVLIRAVRADERERVIGIYEGMIAPQNRSNKFIAAIRARKGEMK